MYISVNLGYLPIEAYLPNAATEGELWLVANSGRQVMMIDENIGSVWYQEVEEGELSGPLSMKRKIGVTWLKYQF